MKLITQRPIVIIVVLLALAGVFAFVSFRRAAGPAAITESPTVKAGQQPAGLDGESETLVYSNPEPRFSFRYPSGFTVSPIEDESGGTLLVRNPNEPRQEFQIRVSEFDEPFDPAQGRPGPITKERILKDIPDMVVEQAQTVAIGGVSALAFVSRDESLGQTREVWFVSGGFLYQITAYAEMDEVLGKILKTWEFR